MGIEHIQKRIEWIKSLSMADRQSIKEEYNFPANLGFNEMFAPWSPPNWNDKAYTDSLYQKIIGDQKHPPQEKVEYFSKNDLTFIRYEVNQIKEGGIRRPRIQGDGHARWVYAKGMEQFEAFAWLCYGREGKVNAMDGEVRGCHSAIPDTKYNRGHGFWSKEAKRESLELRVEMIDLPA